MIDKLDDVGECWFFQGQDLDGSKVLPWNEKSAIFYNQVIQKYILSCLEPLEQV